MRKPELEPVIKTDTDSDTTPDIPDIPDVPVDTAPSGSGGPSLPDTPYNGPEDASGLPELPELPQSQAAPSVGGGGGPSLPEASGGGDSGTGDLPELPEESESPDLKELAESIQEYLQELDPQEVSDTMQSLLSELQQVDYSFLSELPDVDLSPEEANAMVHDMLTELQQLDYYAFTEDYLHKLTAEEIESGLKDLIFGNTEGFDPSHLGTPLWDILEKPDLKDYGPGVDTGFQLFSYIKDFWDVIHFKNLLPGKLVELALEKMGLKDIYNKYAKDLLDWNGDGKEHWAGAFLRNLIQFLMVEALGNKLGKLYEKLLGKIGLHPKSATILSVPLKHIPNGYISLRKGMQLMIEDSRYRLQQRADALARQEELDAIKQAEADAKAAAIAEEEKANEEARRIETEETEAANREEAAAKEENARIEREAKEQNAQAEQDAKAEADRQYQSQEAANNAERDKTCNDAAATRDKECEGYRNERDEQLRQIDQREQTQREELAQWEESQRNDAADRCNRSMEEAQTRFETGEGTVAQRQAQFHQEKLAAQEKLQADNQAIDTAVSQRSHTITEENNQAREEAKDKCAQQEAGSQTRYEATCRQADEQCAEKNQQAESIRQDAYRDAEQTRKNADHAAEQQREKADKPVTEKADQARADAHQKSEDAQAKNAEIRQGKCDEISRDAQSQRDAVNSRHDQIAADHADQHDKNRQGIEDAARQDTQKVNDNFDKISNSKSADKGPSLPEVPEQTAGEGPSLPNDVSNDVVESAAPTKGHTGLGQ